METINVKIAEGEIQGRICESQNGRRYFSFTGIPYGEPPIGKLRFQEPMPVKKWTNVKDVTHDDSSFIQFNPFLRVQEGTEELLINVYTPSLSYDRKTPLPVMVFLHGGGFMMGSPKRDEFNPENLLEKGVVVVTVQYRLGVFGFLCLDIPEAAGNAGLKDQVLALTWVQRNIGFFNGDQLNVTIFGSSAGGASVEYHLLSPLSRQLFHKAISHSGSALNPWALHYDSRSNAFALAKVLGKDTKDKRELIELLISAPAQEIVMASLQLSLESEKCPTGGLNFPFGPVIENEYSTVTCFLSENPIDILKAGRQNIVPYVTGFCGKEGMFMEQFHPQKFANAVSAKSFISYLPFKIDDNDDIIKDIEQFYSGSHHYDMNCENNAIDFFGDTDFIGGILVSAKLHANRNANIYLFNFTYDGSYNVIKALLGLKRPGATHADIEGYVAKKKYLPEGSVADEKLLEKVTEMWTNFAKTGNPSPSSTPKWLPIRANSLINLNISNELVMEKNAFDDVTKLWERIYKFPRLS